MATVPATTTEDDPGRVVDAREVRLGRAFIEAVVNADFPRLASLLAADVRFRALVPRTSLEVASADAAREIFDDWFGETDERELLDSSVELVADRLLITYRLRLYEAGRLLVVEQHLVATVADDRLRDVALLCSGFRPVTGTASEPAIADPPPHADARLDGTGLSCATLTPSIRAALIALEPGQVLEIVADDPTAEDGLRSWTRLTGHELIDRTTSAEAAGRFYVRRSSKPGPTVASGGGAR